MKGPGLRSRTQAHASSSNGGWTEASPGDGGPQFLSLAISDEREKGEERKNCSLLSFLFQAQKEKPSRAEIFFSYETILRKKIICPFFQHKRKIEVRIKI